MTGKISRFLVHAVLLVGMIISLFPFYWMIVMSTNSTGDVFKFPPKLTFGSQLMVNIQHVLESIDFWGSFANTVLVAVATTALVLFVDSLAAFVFAKFEFPGKKPLFVILLATFMVPA